MQVTFNDLYEMLEIDHKTGDIRRTLLSTLKHLMLMGRVTIFMKILHSGATLYKSLTILKNA